MPKLSQGTLTLAGLAVFAVWLFGVLPFLYGPPPRFAEAGSPPHTQSEQAGQHAATKPDGSAHSPFFIRIPKTTQEATQEADDRKEKAATDWWLMIFTGAVALFTFLLVGATVLLYRAGERQLALATKTAEQQLRAYVNVKNAYVLNVADKTKRIITVEIENFGQTPAHDMILHGTAKALEWPLKRVLVLPPLDRSKVSIAPLAPRCTTALSIPLSILSDWEETQLQQGRAGIYTWGEIYYRDSFGVDQRTWFRLVCEGEGLPEGKIHATQEGNGCT
jgi:hypothetical protein